MFVNTPQPPPRLENYTKTREVVLIEYLQLVPLKQDQDLNLLVKIGSGFRYETHLGLLINSPPLFNSPSNPIRFITRLQSKFSHNAIFKSVLTTLFHQKFGSKIYLFVKTSVYLPKTPPIAITKQLKIKYLR